MKRKTRAQKKEGKKEANGDAEEGQSKGTKSKRRKSSTKDKDDKKANGRDRKKKKESQEEKDQAEDDKAVTDCKDDSTEKNADEEEKVEEAEEEQPVTGSRRRSARLAQKTTTPKRKREEDAPAKKKKAPTTRKKKIKAELEVEEPEELEPSVPINSVCRLYSHLWTLKQKPPDETDQAKESGDSKKKNKGKEKIKDGEVDEELYGQCWRTINQYFFVLLAGDQKRRQPLLDLPVGALLDLLKSDSLQVENEAHLLILVAAWANHRIELEEKAATNDSISGDKAPMEEKDQKTAGKEETEKDGDTDSTSAAQDQQDYVYLDVPHPEYTGSFASLDATVPLEKRGEDYENKLKEYILPFLDYIRFPAVEASVLQEAEWLIPPHILHDVFRWHMLSSLSEEERDDTGIPPLHDESAPTYLKPRRRKTFALGKWNGRYHGWRLLRSLEEMQRYMFAIRSCYDKNHGLPNLCVLTNYTICLGDRSYLTDQYGSACVPWLHANVRYWSGYMTTGVRYWKIGTRSGWDTWPTNFTFRAQPQRMSSRLTRNGLGIFISTTRTYAF